MKQLAALLPSKSLLPGWKSSPSQDDESDADSRKDNARMAACLGVPDYDSLQYAEADTPDFSHTTTDAYQEISVSASSYKTVAAVTADVNTLRNPRAASCLKQQFATMGKGAWGGKLTYVSSTVTVTPGETAHLAGRIDAVVKLKSAGGQITEVGITELELYAEGVEESVNFTVLGEPVSAAVADAFVEQTVAKLVAATSSVSA